MSHSIQLLPDRHRMLALAALGERDPARRHLMLQAVADSTGARTAVSARSSSPGADTAVRAPSAKQAAQAVEEIVTTAVARSVGARRRWLEPLQEELQRLASLAANAKVSDADLVQLLTLAKDRLPEMNWELDRDALAKDLNAAAGTAAVAALEKRLQ